MSGAVARVLKPLGGDVSLTAHLNKTGAVSQFRVHAWNLAYLS